MDCEKCKHKFEPVWTPPVARFKPNAPLPDGAVCIRLDTSADIYWTRTGTYIYVYRDWQNYGFTAQAYAEATRALGLPVYDVDINCGGETTEEFWTDEECRKRQVHPIYREGVSVYLPCTGPSCDASYRLVTLLRRYHGTRKDGVAVDGWIIKPVAVEKAKPAPGQPCPACGQPVPEQENPPPAPFKVGDWVRHRTGDRGRASFVERVEWIGGLWKIHLNSYEYFADDYEILRPALPPLPGEIKDWVVAGIRPTGDIPSNRFVARFLRDLYPHEFGGE